MRGFVNEQNEKNGLAWGNIAFSEYTSSLWNSNSKSDDTLQKKLKQRKKTSTEKSSEKKSTYAIGDKIVFDKQAEYTITNVEWSDERNDFDEQIPIKY